MNINLVRQLVFSLCIGLCAVSSANATTSAVVSASSALPVATAGGDSYNPIISPDGRYVLFASTANNVAMNGTNVTWVALVPARINVFLRDRVSGTTTLVSVKAAGTGGGNGDSIPTIQSSVPMGAMCSLPARRTTLP